MIFRQSAFKETKELPLEQRILDLEAKVCFLESQLKMTIDTDPCFYRGYHNPPQIGLIQAINLILGHLKIRLYEVPPIGSQTIVRTEKDILAERKKLNEQY